MSDEREWQSHDQCRARLPAGTQRLTRSHQRVLGGVAAGVAGFVGVGALAVRLLWLVSLPLSGGITGVAYLLLWLLLPAGDGADRAGG